MCFVQVVVLTRQLSLVSRLFWPAHLVLYGVACGTVIVMFTFVALADAGMSAYAAAVEVACRNSLLDDFFLTDKEKRLLLKFNFKIKKQQLN